METELLSIALDNIAQRHRAARKRRRQARRDALGTLALAGAAFTCLTAAVACAVALWLLTPGRI